MLHIHAKMWMAGWGQYAAPSAAFPQLVSWRLLGAAIGPAAPVSVPHLRTSKHLAIAEARHLASYGRRWHGCASCIIVNVAVSREFRDLIAVQRGQP